MESPWKFVLNVIALDVAVGNVLAGAIGVAPDDDKTFTLGTKLKHTASGSTTAVFASVPLKQSSLDYCTEFTSAGPYPLLNASGLTNEQITAAKAVMLLEFGPRAQYEGHGLAFIASHGYEIIPQG